MMYRVMNHYENSEGWNDEEIFSSDSLNDCIEVAIENGGWSSEECYVNVMDENDYVVWE